MLLPHGPHGSSTAPAFFKDHAKGEGVTKGIDGWGHPGCAPRKLSAADHEFALSKALIEHGDTLRSRKPSDWRLGSSPSSHRATR
ncbi:hypothetical protein ABT354_23355 [Streptomyces sp. NPDC000594]|uniref:hypothetical protein n=1 Tax=Streptomyces sp. NPDC000594 TaxID=3154261 RepID=UPI00331C3130